MGEPLPANADQVAASSESSAGSTLSGPSLPTPQPLHLPSPLTQLPVTIGRYRILKLLGQGGMGAVYSAEDNRLGRNVALKIPHFGTGGDGRHLARFQREARIAATFHHPNLCPVYDVGEVCGIPYVTMPFLRGVPLAELLRREGRLPPAQAVRLVRLVAAAMAVAHAAGVIHRDLKPANIMINEQGEPVVMDFGLARQSTTDDPRLTGPVALLGTPAYAPPEQVGGHPDTLGPACDVYSLGVTLYETLTGRLPFVGRSDEVLRQVLSQEPPPPSRFVPELDSRLDKVCLRALAKEPAERFPTMIAFAEALDQAIAENEVQSPKRVEPARTKGRLPRRCVLALAVGITFFLLVGMCAVLFQIWPGLLSYVQTTGQPTDAFQAGTSWSGPYEWLPPMEGGGHILVKVVERQGDDFKGTYTSRSNEARYEWRIEGKVEANAVRWHFTEAIHEDKPAGVVEKANVQGTLDGPTMELNYRDADSAAHLHLRLQK